MSIAGRLFLGLSTFSTIWSVVALAAAQTAPPAPGTPPKKQQKLILTKDTADIGHGDRARARARAGDCKAALDLYDLALRTSIDPSLRRDRGLCHEQLGSPYPAIDDYRAYLKDRPNAPDSEQIRERLLRLEEQLGLNIRTNDNVDNPNTKPDSGASASASISINDDGVSGNATSSPSSAHRSGSQADFEADEKLAAAASGSSLREASGWAIGPYFSVRSAGDIAYTQQGLPGKLKQGLHETVGGAIRYSLGKTSTIISEFGYVGFNDANIAGPGVFLGYEARLALSKWTSDAIIVGFGLGYERYRANDTGAILNNVLPRARLGYRHVFGPSLGLEIHGDGGAGKYFLNDPPPGLSSFPITPVFGVYLALLVGF
jgi:Tetratricopeptide repeat